jgi:MFS transporter, FHS family, glucose/mannose:H+ symporter
MNTASRQADRGALPGVRYAGRRVMLLLLCTVFLASGLVMAAFGPALPGLAVQTGRSLAALGSLFIAVFGGSLLAQLVGGQASDRFGRRLLLVISCAIYGAGILGVAFGASLWITIVMGVLLGLGYGGSTLAVNVLASELSPDRRASTVNLVNVFYALGAIAGPLVAGLFLSLTGSATPTLWIAAILLIALAPVLWRALPATLPERTIDPTGRDRAAPVTYTLMSGLFLLLYVGSESSVGAWTPVYLQRSVALGAADAASATSIFWLALCVGRLAAVVAGLRLTAERLLLWSLAGGTTAAAALVVGHGSVLTSVVSFGALGFAFAPIYPTTIAIITGRFPGAAGTVTSRVQALASIGGMTLPWTQGLVLTKLGTLAFALVLLTVVAAMPVVWTLLRRAAPRPAATRR